MPAIVNPRDPETRLAINIKAIRQSFDASGQFEPTRVTSSGNRAFIVTKAIGDEQEISLLLKAKPKGVSIKIGGKKSELARALTKAGAKAASDELDALSQSTEPALSPLDIARLDLWHRITAHVLLGAAVPDVLKVEVERTDQRGMTILLKHVREGGHWATATIRILNKRESIQSNIESSGMNESSGAIKLVTLLAAMTERMPEEQVTQLTEIGPGAWPTALSLFTFLPSPDESE